MPACAKAVKPVHKPQRRRSRGRPGCPKPSVLQPKLSTGATSCLANRANVRLSPHQPFAEGRVTGKKGNLRQSLTLERIAELSTTSPQNGGACATPHPRPFSLGRRGGVLRWHTASPHPRAAAAIDRQDRTRNEPRLVAGQEQRRMGRVPAGADEFHRHARRALLAQIVLG